MPKIGLIVQARVGSKRLPGKSLMPLAGEPLVGRVLERLKYVKNIDALILAIPSQDDSLASVGKNHGVEVFRGSEYDLLDRYYRAAKEAKIDTIVRIPADNVATEPGEVDKIINYYHSHNYEFCSNLSQVFNNGYPDGIGAEIFSFKMLEKVWRQEFSPHKREHIHLNFFDYDTQMAERGIKVGTISCPLSFARPDIVLDVNTGLQYEKMAKMYADLYQENSIFSINDIVKWWDMNIMSEKTL